MRFGGDGFTSVIMTVWKLWGGEEKGRLDWRGPLGM
jgi:hypothetical protein